MAKIPKDAQVEIEGPQTIRKIPKDATVQQVVSGKPNVFVQALKLMQKPSDIAWDAAASVYDKGLGPESTAGAGLRGFGHGASFGFTDELRGLGGMANEAVSRIGLPDPLGVNSQQFPNSPLTEAMRKRYVQERDSARHEEDVATEEHPIAHGTSEVAGALMAPNPFGKLGAAGRAGRLASAGAQGALAGAGMSRGDNLADVAKDTATGGTIGLGTGAVAEAASVPLRALIRKGGAVKAKAVADRTAKDLADTDKEVASALGKYRGKTQEASRDMEVLARQGDPRSVPAEVEAHRYLMTPEAEELADAVVKGKLESAPERAADMLKLKAQYQALKSGAPAEAARRTSDYFEKGAMTEVSPRARTYFTRAMGPLIGGAGGAAIGSFFNLGPAETAALTGVLGAGAGAAMGAPGTALANMLKSPRFRFGAGGALQKAAGAGVRGVESLAKPVAMAGSQDAKSDPFTGLSKEEQDALRTWLADQADR